MLPQHLHRPSPFNFCIEEAVLFRSAKAKRERENRTNWNGTSYYPFIKTIRHWGIEETDNDAFKRDFFISYVFVAKFA